MTPGTVGTISFSLTRDRFDLHASVAALIANYRRKLRDASPPVPATSSNSYAPCAATPGRSPS